MKKLFIIFFLFGAVFSLQAQENPANKAKPLYGGYIGLGYTVLTDELSDYFNNPFILPLTGDFVYKRFVAQLDLNEGWAKVKKTMVFPDSSSWNDGDNAFHSSLGLTMGFSVYNSAKVRVTPIVGYSFNLLTKKWWGSSDISEYEPEVSQLNIGVLFDLKDTFVTRSNASSMDHNDDYVGIRITAGIYMPMNDPSVFPEYYKGSMIYFSVGIISLNLIN